MTDGLITRDDVMLGSKKVSGTAAKLGRDAAYHHCTLLLNVDTSFLHSALNRYKQGGIKCGNRGTGFLDSEGSHR